MAASIRTAVCLGLALAAPWAQARAATITSDAFVATIGPTIEFLDAAGRLALDHSPNVRAFARAEVASQDRAAARLAGWRRADAAALARDASGASLDRLGPVAGLLKLPYAAVADATAPLNPPLTGLPSADRLRAAFQQDLARLATLDGAAFVDLYAPTQVAALERLEAAYKDFILNGDDPMLRRLAVGALPQVEHLLAQTRSL